ncbi:MAG TPA: PEGA domain-containing protein [Planctomycetes bacterium]|nr:PEGA domain-containing protein [Planctomycetota bacterium]HIL36286.1 PEGA domain-containing protein [Planctomycetota bacterium]
MISAFEQTPCASGDPSPHGKAQAQPGPEIRWPARGALLLALGLAACAPIRTLTIESDPAGAQVRLDEELVGQTPLTLPFDFHGTRRISVYLEGYQVWTERVEIKAPWWARFPLDLISDNLIPWRLHDEHAVHAALTPGSGQPEVTGLDHFIEHTTEVHDQERRRTSSELEPLQSSQTEPDETNGGK